MNKELKSLINGHENGEAKNEFLASLIRGTERITESTPIEYEEGFQETFIKAIASGHVPFLFSNHQSHSDGLLMAQLTKELIEMSSILPENLRLRGMNMPIAASIRSGHQGIHVKTFFEKLEPLANKRDVDMPNWVRPKDKDEYGMTGINMAVSREIVEDAGSNIGLIYFPEGTVDGGRQNGGKNGIKGMRHFEEGAIEFMTRLLLKRREVLYVPVGISGGHKFFDPDTYMPTKAASDAIFGDGNPQIVSMKVGLCFRPGDAVAIMRKMQKPVDLNAFCEKQVARLLPPSERGEIDLAA